MGLENCVKDSVARFVFLLMLSSVLSLFFASAVVAGSLACTSAIAACPSGYSSVLRLYTASNSHASLPSDVSTPYNICCADTSGKNTVSASGNTFMKLYAASNSHVGLGASAFPVEAKIGGSVEQVACEVVSGACSSGKSCVVALTSADNAHAGDCTTDVVTHPQRVCCGFVPATVDATAPVTVASATSNGQAYVFGTVSATPVIVSLACSYSDAGASGCKEIRICFDKIDCVPNVVYSYSDANPLLFAGTQSVCFSARDNAGNVEPVQCKKVVIGSPCAESWQCGAWSTCVAGQQSRTCNDVNNCGTVLAKPPVTQACVVAPTCSDGVKNGDEVGVDCGGSQCGACGAGSLWPGDGVPTDVLSGNNFVLANGAGFAQGLFGQAFSLDGVDDKTTSLRSVPIVGSDPAMSIDGWFNFASVATGGHIMAGFILNPWLARSGFALFQGYIGAGSVSVEFYGVQGCRTPVNTVVANRWYHIAATKSPGVFSVSTVKLYIDGVQQALTCDNAGGAMNIQSAPFLLGNDGANEVSDKLRVDEVEVLSRVLSPAEVAVLAAKKPLPSVIASLDASTFPSADVQRSQRDVSFTQVRLVSSSGVLVSAVKVVGVRPDSLSEVAVWANGQKVGRSAVVAGQSDYVVPLTLSSSVVSVAAAGSLIVQIKGDVRADAVAGDVALGVDRVDVQAVAGAAMQAVAVSPVVMGNVMRVAVPVIPSLGNLVCEPAQSSCPSGSVAVARLLASENSHVSIPGDSSAPVVICCKDASGRNTVAAGVGNPFLFLSVPLLGHAGSVGSVFQNALRMDGSLDQVSCSLGQGSCAAGQACVARLIRSDNSHVAVCSASSVLYPLPVCCSLTSKGVDTVAPTTVVSSAVSDGKPYALGSVASKDVTLGLTCTDMGSPASGCASTRFCQMNTACPAVGACAMVVSDCVPATAGTTAVVSAQGANRVCFDSVDNAGNRGPARCADVVIKAADTLPPVTTLTGSVGGANYVWGTSTVGPVAVTVLCADASGCASQYCLGVIGAADCVPALGALVIPVSSSQRICVQSTDNAGNKNAVQCQNVVIALPCVPSWNCGSFGPCVNGKQIRTCVDVNGCGLAVPTSMTEQACVCTEAWSCGAWSTCVNGQQSRACNDANNCATVLTKPPVTQACVVAPTCSDGVKNGDEVGVDCGGSQCAVCPPPVVVSLESSVFPSVDVQRSQRDVSFTQVRLVSSSGVLVSAVKVVGVRPDSLSEVAVWANGQKVGRAAVVAGQSDYVVPLTLSGVVSVAAAGSLIVQIKGDVRADAVAGDVALGVDRVDVQTVAGAATQAVAVSPVVMGNPMRVVVPACVPVWQCSGFGACVNGKRTQTCPAVNSCGTTQDRPALEEVCVPSAGNLVCEVAQNSCPSGSLAVARLLRSENSAVSVPADSAAPTVICCRDASGRNALSVAGNPFLMLSKSSLGHAGFVGSAFVNALRMDGSLDQVACSLEQGSCAVGQACVLRLVRADNSHAAVCSGSALDYPKAVCCAFAARGVDTVPPTTTVSSAVSDGKPYALGSVASKDVSLALSCVDGGSPASGCASTRFCQMNTACPAVGACAMVVGDCVPATVGTTAVVSAQGANRVCFDSTDVAGNLAPARCVDVVIKAADTLPPVTTLTGSVGGANYVWGASTPGPVAVTVACTDAGGCNSQYCLGAIGAECVPNLVVSGVLSVATSQRVCVQSTDNAGNKNAVQCQNVVIAAAPPVCNPNWQCTAFGGCVNGQQVRTCTDSNVCGVLAGKPLEVQACVVAPTCTDRIQNGVETGVDCGGSCPACPVIPVNSPPVTTMTGAVGGVNYAWGVSTPGPVQVAVTCTDDKAGCVAKHCLVAQGTCTPTVVGNPVLLTASQVVCAQSIDSDGVLDAAQCRSVVIDSAPVCVPVWECTSFGGCINGQQVRTCTDARACGVLNGKPGETQACSASVSDVVFVKPTPANGAAVLSLPIKIAVAALDASSCTMTVQPDLGGTRNVQMMPSTGDFTWALWIKPNERKASSLVTHGGETAGGYDFLWNGGTVSLGAPADGCVSDSLCFFDGSVWRGVGAQIITEQFSHVAVVRRGQSVRFFVNGEERGDVIIPPFVPSTSSPVRFGGVTRFFKGGVDDVRFYDVALSAEQVRNLAWAQDVASGLVAHWPAEGLAATELMAARNGQLVGGSASGIGRIGTAWVLDGIDDAVVVPHNSVFDPDYAGDGLFSAYKRFAEEIPALSAKEKAVYSVECVTPAKTAKSVLQSVIYTPDVEKPVSLVSIMSGGKVVRLASFGPQQMNLSFGCTDFPVQGGSGCSATFACKKDCTTSACVVDSCDPTRLVYAGPVALSAYWKADALVPALPGKDSVGSSDAQVWGSVSTVPGRFGEAWKLSKDGDFLSVPANALFGPESGGASGDFTLALWVNPSEKRNASLVARGSAQAGGVGTGYELGINVCGNDMLCFSDGVAWRGIPAALSVGQWSHVAAVREGRHVQFFVNGELRGDVPVQQHIPEPAVELRFGSILLPLGHPSQRGFRGLMDDVRYYRAALTQSQVMSVINEADPMTFTSTGTLCVKSVDNAGNVEVPNCSLMGVDGVAPKTVMTGVVKSASQDEYDFKTTVRKPVRVMLGCVDTGGSGCVANTPYCLGDNCEPNVQSSEDLEFNKTGSTIVTLCARAVDKAGNLGNKICNVVRVDLSGDTESPETVVDAVLSDGSKYVSGTVSGQDKVTYTLKSCKDKPAVGATGCASTKNCVTKCASADACGKAQDCLPAMDWKVNGTVVFAERGVSRFCFASADVEGNQANPECHVVNLVTLNDTTPPETTIAITPVQGMGGVTDKVVIKCSDSGDAVSGCAKTVMCVTTMNDCVPSIPYSQGDAGIFMTRRSDAQLLICARSTDRAGNNDTGRPCKPLLPSRDAMVC